MAEQIEQPTLRAHGYPGGQRGSDGGPHERPDHGARQREVHYRTVTRTAAERDRPDGAVWARAGQCR